MKVVSKTRMATIYLITAAFLTVPVFAFDGSGKGMVFWEKKFPVDGFIELFIAIGLIFAFKLAQKKNRLL